MSSDRGVKQDAAGLPRDRECFGICHAFQHFNIQLANDPADLCYLDGPTKVEEVMTCDPNSNSLRMIQVESDINEAGVTRIYL